MTNPASHQIAEEQSPASEDGVFDRRMLWQSQLTTQFFVVENQEASEMQQQPVGDVLLKLSSSLPPDCADPARLRHISEPNGDQSVHSLPPRDQPPSTEEESANLSTPLLEHAAVVLTQVAADEEQEERLSFVNVIGPAQVREPVRKDG